MNCKKRKSVYVCHTYYHVYVSMLKELAKPNDEQGYATLILSTMSTDFECFDERIRATNYFEAVYVYEEANFEQLPEVKKYHHPSKNFIISIWNRFLFTKKYGKAQEKLVPVDFKNYDDVYVFCDSDPIGYYLNYKHIYYHSIEDGLNTLVLCDAARVDNEANFKIKTFMSKKLNLIFIQNGYSKYCIDMEVNDVSLLEYPCPYYVEVNREKLVNRLTKEDKDILKKVFIKDYGRLEKLLSTRNERIAMILTEPLCSLDVRKQIFEDIISEYESEYKIIIKQHPRDYLNYEVEFPDIMLVDRTVPMEMLNFFEGFEVDLVIGVFTELAGITYAKEKRRLGRSFMDKYEDPELHAARFESSSHVK